MRGIGEAAVTLLVAASFVLVGAAGVAAADGSITAADGGDVDATVVSEGVTSDLRVATAGVPVEDWNITHGYPTDSGQAWDIERTGDGYVVAGKERIAFTDDTDGFVHVVNDDGEVEFSRWIGDSNYQQFLGVTETGEGNYVAVGWTVTDDGDLDAFVAKVAANGTVLWTETYGGSEGDQAFDVVPAHGSGYVVALTSDSFGPGGDDAGLLHVDADGDVVASEYYGTSGEDEAVWDLERLDDGGYALAGTQDTSGSPSAFVVEADGFLAEEGFQTYDGMGEAYGYGIEQTADGEYVIAGQTWFDTDDREAWLAEVDATTGEVYWSESIDETGENEFFMSVGERDDGSLFAAGSVTRDGDPDALAVETFADGLVQWSTTAGGDDTENAWAGGVPTDDGGFALAGETDSYGDGVNTWVYRAGAANEPPTAGLEWSPETPVVGEETIFYADEPSADPDGEITNYEFDTDGDGVYESETSLGFTYVTFETTGLHTVGVRVTDDDGATDTETVTVDVAAEDNEPPNATLVPSTDDPVVGEEVTFGAEASDPDGNVTTYEWDLDGDGFYEEETSLGFAFHTFDTAGNHTVGLRVTDDDGATDTDTVTVDVAAEGNEPPTATLTWEPDDPVVGETVVLDGDGSTDPDGEIIAYEWDLDDDGSYEAEGSSVLHTFETAGSHSVTLRLTDDDGATVTETAVLDIDGPAPTGPSSTHSTTAGRPLSATRPRGRAGPRT